MSGRVLVVDDEPEMCSVLADGLGEQGFSVVTRGNAAAALEVVRGGDVDVVLTDLAMRGVGGIELCGDVANEHPEVPVIVMTGFGSMESAIAAIRAGAYDFINKPIDLDAVALTVQRAVEHKRLREAVRLLEATVERIGGDGGVIGESSAMLAALEVVDRVAASNVPVLVTGETGTGKELIARELHRRSRRREGPFVALNCAAVPEALLEAQLFGHVRGAFTDAREARTGLLVQAGGGTLFLDEVGDMPPAMQAKLLRALQEHTVRPLGAEREVAFDARIVAATHRDLDTEVAEGRFREDLYWRLVVVHVALPPLRERGGDVLLLAQRFLHAASRASGKEVTGFTPEAAKKLVDYGWPGNVRELQNCVERAVAMTRWGTLGIEDLPERVRAASKRDLVLSSEDPSSLPTLDEVERRYIQHVLEATGWNKLRAASILGIDRTTLYRKLDRHGLAREPE